jgi:hypothetical protein
MHYGHNLWQGGVVVGVRWGEKETNEDGNMHTHAHTCGTMKMCIGQRSTMHTKLLIWENKSLPCPEEIWILKNHFQLWIFKPQPMNYSFSQQIFIHHLLNAKHYSRCRDGIVNKTKKADLWFGDFGCLFLALDWVNCCLDLRSMMGMVCLGLWIVVLGLHFTWVATEKTWKFTSEEDLVIWNYSAHTYVSCCLFMGTAICYSYIYVIYYTFMLIYTIAFFWDYCSHCSEIYMQP